MNKHDFHIGKAFDAYEFFGAHIEKDGVVFRTYAPNAFRVTVIGEFNFWQDTEMKQDGQSGIFSCKVKNAKEGMMYKYRIYSSASASTDHADPYGFGMELRPASASIIRDLSKYQFGDQKWVEKRTKRMLEPLNIYELHLGSWKTNRADENGWYKYNEIADELIAYVKDHHYNYIEFMPLSEHPADCSWGYQNTGFFSPTSRYGTAEELMELVDKCHQAGIGVIMDYVPVHFAVDYYGLAHYDGTALYEYPHEDTGVSEWGSYNFIHSRGEVRSFLQSAANYWLDKYHFDGIRMDAISRIIYWQGDPARGVNEQSVEFIKVMNDGLHKLHPHVILMAEDSTNYPDVTQPVKYGGLGFNYKWDMGWMNDTLDYFKKTPGERALNYHKLSFSMMYFYNERYILPLSHDEVVHGKATIIQKMFGEYEDKFRQARAFYMYMYAHPGKKLNFMGNEIAQFREWDESREQDWDLLEYPMHDAFHKFMKELNGIYMKHAPMYEWDFRTDGFKWLDCQQEDKCIYVFSRKTESEEIVIAMNLSDKDYLDYELECQEPMKIKVMLHSDWDIYGGSTPKKLLQAAARMKDGKYKVNIKLPGYSCVYFKRMKTK